MLQRCFSFLGSPIALWLMFSSFVLANENGNWATVRYLPGDGSPTIEKSLFEVSSESGWLICQTRLSRLGNGEDCWGYGRRESIEELKSRDPQHAEKMTKAVKQLAPNGNYRPHLEALLADDAQMSGGDFDRALTNGQFVWHIWNWADGLQVKIKDHVLYVAFYHNHNSRENVPVEAVIVGPTGTRQMEQSASHVNSEAALEFRSQGKFAHCAQQALLDAGFDPKGVDGAPGAGARNALERWTQSSKIEMPTFSHDSADQICFALTAPSPQFADVTSKGVIIRSSVWPLFPGVFYNDNKMNVSLLGARRDFWQSVRVSFGQNKLRYGDQNNRDIRIPWDVRGSIVAHGNDAPQSILQSLVLTDGFHRKVLSQMLQSINIQLLDKTLKGNSTGKILWSQVAEEVYLADILLDGSLPQFRVLIFFRTGKNPTLLYGGMIRDNDWTFEGEF